MFFFVGILLIIALFLEGTVTTLPLVLLGLLCLTIMKRDASVFPIAFVVGFFLDLLTARSIGSTSWLFVLFVFVLLMYQRKYEINSYPFVGFAAFLGSVIFLLVFGVSNFLGLALLSSLIALVMFGFLRFLIARKVVTK